MRRDKLAAYSESHHKPFNVDGRVSVPVNPVTCYLEQLRSIWNIK